MKAKLNPNLLIARRNGDYLDPDGSIMENTGRFGRRNNNTLVVGSAGTGKTAGKGYEEILSGAGGASMVISDVKGTLYEKCAPTLKIWAIRYCSLTLLPRRKVCTTTPLTT